MSAYLISNAESVLKALENAKRAALEAVGIAAEGYAKGACPADTGRLRASIGHAVEGDTVYVGTNVEYAPYVEFGTGPKCILGGGSTVTVNPETGAVRSFSGQAAQPFLKPAIADHLTQYRQYIEGALK